MIEEVNAARSGHSGALEALVTRYLPLVYGVVRRALSSQDHADVDDVVQDTMLRVLRGIGDLREPDRFRSWLVAITVNQIRDHRKRSHTGVRRLEECAEQPDPGAGFVDLALTRLAVAQQRREIEPAVRWLSRRDRALLSLWLRECEGDLTRADIAEILEVNAHNVAVRVRRMKTRLDAARLLVLALAVTPRCAELADVAREWPGEPTALWRKRFLRHVGECRRCRSTGGDLVPLERLVSSTVLLPLPADPITAQSPQRTTDGILGRVDAREPPWGDHLSGVARLPLSAVSSRSVPSRSWG